MTFDDPRCNETERRNAYRSDSERYDRLRENMRVWSDNPSGRDQIEADFYKAALEHLAKDEVFGDVIREFVSVRPELNQNHLRYLPVRCFQKIATRLDRSYPTDFDVSRWDEVISSTLKDSELRTELEHDLHTRHLQTNVADRYKSIPPLAAMLREHGRVGRSMRLLDIGCSANHGLKKLSLMDIIPGVMFSETRFVQAEDELRPWERLTESPELTLAFRSLQNLPLGLRDGLGIDKEDMRDAESRKWARACLAPREYESGEVHEYDLIDVIEPRQICFEQRDFLDSDQTKFLETSPEDHGFYDIVTMLTVLNQLSDRQRQQMLRVARRYVKPTGLLILQDFARPHPDNRFEIEFLDADWNEHFSYQTIYMDMMSVKEGYQVAWRFDGGRCGVVQAGLGSLAIKGPSDDERTEARTVSIRSFLDSTVKSIRD
jgi:SAM-dependent methyltransferase